MRRFFIREKDKIVIMIFFSKTPQKIQKNDLFI